MDRGLQSFTDWMNGGGVGSLVVTLALVASSVPLIVLIHELGHAVVGLIRTEGLVNVRVGRTPPRWRTRLGRLELELNPVLARNSPAGLAKVYAESGVGTQVALILAGPLAEAAAGAVILVVGVHLRLGLAAIVGGFWILNALLNLVPRTRHGRSSDGACLVAALRKARTAPREPAGSLERTLADTFSRWVVQFTTAKGSVQTPRRMGLLGGAPVALGHAPDDRGTLAVSLWRLAYAGWCWREVEHGDFARIREAALDAVHAATTAGAVEPNLTGLATRTLATGTTDLALASPGVDDDERRRFLDTALLRIPTAVRLPSIPEEHQRFAFRYGIALHDVERVRGTAA